MRRQRGLYAVATAVVLLALAPTPNVHARPIEPDGTPARPAPASRETWVVTVRDGIDAEVRGKKLAAKVGGEAKKSFRHALNGFVFEGSAKAAAEMRGLDAVRSVVPDGPMRVAAELLPVGIGRIDASHPSRPDAHDSGFTGTGARIAILDTGVDLAHPDLVANLDVELGLNCMTAGPPQDGHGHGTHVAGIAAGVTGNGIGTIGVAPAARIVPLKVLDDTGYGEWSNLICAVDYLTGLALDGDPSNNIHVANMSLGDTGGVGSCNDGFVREAICNSVAAGIVYVAAAGNSTVDAATFIPAAFPEVITVSAMTDLDGSKGGLGGCAAWIFYCDDTLAEFSNFGASTIDVTAPGYNIYSSWIGGTYRYESGTSMAAPHVAGVAALARAARPGLSPADVEDLLVISGECPNGQWADAGASSDCAGQGQWGNDPDGRAEPLINALRAAQGAASFNAAPAVEIISPATGAAVSGVAPVEVEASDDVGVESVEFLLNGKVFATDNDDADGWGIDWDTRLVDPGAYSLTATAIDTGGRRASDSVDIRVGANLQGDWVGTYGADGYALFAWTATSDVVLLPGASLTVDRGTRSSLGVIDEPQVLESPDQAERRVGVWYDATQVQLRLTFADAYAGGLHLYALDYATFDRRQRFTVDDGSGAQVTELSTVFHDGAWLHFPISVAAGGTVSIVVDKIAGANVLINGLFLGEGPPEPPEPAAPGAPILESATPGDGQVVVGWAAPVSDGGSPITSYTATATPDGATCSSIGPTTCAITGLTNGTSYSFTVRATNAVGTGPTSNALTATPSAVPSAPQNFGAEGGDGYVSLSWTAPASDGGSTITGYQLYRGTSSGNVGPLITLGNVKVYTDDDVTNGTTLVYRLTALSSSGEGASTPEVSATPEAPITPPGAPTLSSATAGNGQVALAWTAPASDGGSPITSYTATATPGGATCVTTTIDCSIGGLTNGTSYSFSVRATNAAGSSPPSSSISATPRTVPGAPTNLAATPGNGSVTLTWVAPASNGGAPITGYSVITSPGGATCTTTDALSCAVTGLTNGTAYTFWVRAINAAGMSGPSGGVISTPRTVPGPPESVTAATAKAKGVLLTWTAPAANGGAAIANYRIYRRVAGGSFQLIWTLGVRFDYTDTGTVRGREYFYVIKAVNAAGEGPASAEVSAIAK